ncbi:MAG: FHA domain-containing protein [Candidatus Thiodiazotropha sp. (ex Notomyrtea botanica)]|nr:FHA domain-containing protein [Candidatus Thiodiazotropha sp. (ex Notomyrtea botanica)]
MPKLTLSFKGHIIDVFHLEKEETRVGRDEGCDIRIDSLAIAPQQALISQIDDDNHQLSAMDQAFPVLVNHDKIETKSLHHGDVIQIGKHTLSYSEDTMELGADLGTDLRQREVESHPSGDEDQSTSGMLQIMNGENFGRIIPLKRNMTRIGHVGGDCAMVSKRDDGFFLSFLEGAHPPIVNHHAIGDESYRLNEGDIIEVGGTKMQFHA